MQCNQDLEQQGASRSVLSVAGEKSGQGGSGENTFCSGVSNPVRSKMSRTDRTSQAASPMADGSIDCVLVVEFLHGSCCKLQLQDSMLMHVGEPARIANAVVPFPGCKEAIGAI